MTREKEPLLMKLNRTSEAANLLKRNPDLQMFKGEGYVSGLTITREPRMDTDVQEDR